MRYRAFCLLVISSLVSTHSHTIMKLLCSFFILSLLKTTPFGLARDKCSAADITAKQKRTGTLVHRKPQFEVTLFDEYRCPVAIELGCDGFRTVEKIEPNVLVVHSEEYSHPKGSFMAPYVARDFKFPFKVEPNGTRYVRNGEDINITSSVTVMT